jgi:monoamine oxidase
MQEAPEQSFAEFLAGCECDADLKRRATGYVEGFNAAFAERIGLGGLVEQERASQLSRGDRMFRLAGGYDGVVEWLRAALPPDALRLNTPVREVQWQPGRVEMAGFGARRAIVTAPLGVLHAGAIRFEPEPAALRDSASGLEMGPVVKIVLRFREFFWEQRPEAWRMSFLHADGGAFPTWWTAHPIRVPVLVGWAAGPAAAPFARRGEDYLVEQALGMLGGLFRVSTRELNSMLQASYFHDWQADPFACGAYSFVRTGGLAGQQRLAAPVENTLYFAGEATDTSGHIGTVHGAIASAEKTVRAILDKAS